MKCWLRLTYPLLKEEGEEWQAGSLPSPTGATCGTAGRDSNTERQLKCQPVGFSFKRYLWFRWGGEECCLWAQDSYKEPENHRQEANESKGLCLTIRWGSRRAGKSTGRGRNNKHGLQGAPASRSAGRSACSHRQGGMWGCFCLCDPSRGSSSSCRPCTHRADSRPRTALPAHSHKVPCYSHNWFSSLRFCHFEFSFSLIKQLLPYVQIPLTSWDYCYYCLHAFTTFWTTWHAFYLDAKSIC